MKVGFLVISDRVSRGESKDGTAEIVLGFFPDATVKICADEIAMIRQGVLGFSHCDLILTSGGTGLSPRDVTPEAILPLLSKRATGIETLILTSSATPFAALSRSVCGSIASSLVIAMPGSPKAVSEILLVISQIIPHAVDILQNKSSSIQKKHSSINHSHVCIHKPNSSLVSYNSAKSTILSTIKKHSSTIESKHAINFTTAMPYYANENIPAYNASIVDGFALRFIPSKFPYVSTYTKSHMNNCLESDCAYVTTGTNVFDFACVVMIEDTDYTETNVTINSYPKNTNIRMVGSDVSKNDLIISENTQLNQSHICLLLQTANFDVQVYTKPTVTLISTGDEIVEASTRVLGDGCVRDVNSMYLELSLKELYGISAISKFIVKDNEESIMNVLQNAVSSSNIVIISGGVSVGEFDYVKSCLSKLGTVLIKGVAIKPGKPFMFCVCGNTLVFGLPGNPVSCIVTFHLFVRYALDLMNGRKGPCHLNCQAEFDLTGDPFRSEFIRVIVRSDNGKLVCNDTGNQISSRLMSTGNANGLLQLEPGESVKRGQVVKVLLIGDLKDF